MYEPKKKKYNTLKQLWIEMQENGVNVNAKTTVFNGVSIMTKKHIYTLLDGIISIRERS